MCLCFFFFKQKTAYEMRISDWSSVVCSSDLVNGDELAALIEQRGIQVILNAPFSGDPLAGNFGGAPAFYDQYEAGKGSRPWFVIDPPDGKQIGRASSRERVFQYV